VVVGKDTVLTKTDPVAIKVMNRTTGEETDILEAEGPIADTRLPNWGVDSFGRCRRFTARGFRLVYT
jgi:hypothetical protein